MTEIMYSRKGPERQREVRVFEPVAQRFELGGTRIELAAFRLSNLENPEPTAPGLMETGRNAEIMRRYRDRKDFVHRLFGGGLVEIPYTILHADAEGTFGDFSTSDGQDAFADADVLIENGELEPPDWAADLHRFARLKLNRQFALDEELTALRGLERVNGKMRFTVGMSRYSQAFFSMGSEGVKLELTNQEREALLQKGVGSEQLAELDALVGSLRHKFGSGITIRDAILKQVGDLPGYNRRVHHYLLGVAGTVLTRDGDVVFVNRGVGVSINRGINVTASGAVKFRKDFLARYGLQKHLGRQMHEEAKEEIGLRSGDLLLGSMKRRIALELGVDEVEYDLIPVGMARELPRGGSPEAMFMIRYKGDTNDLINKIATNSHDDRSEIDSLAYALPMERARDLIRQGDAQKVLQHKGLLNLMMMDRYLAKQS